jgi:hypothetical protein
MAGFLEKRIVSNVRGFVGVAVRVAAKHAAPRLGNSECNGLPACYRSIRRRKWLLNPGQYHNCYVVAEYSRKCRAQAVLDKQTTLLVKAGAHRNTIVPPTPAAIVP